MSALISGVDSGLEYIPPGTGLLEEAPREIFKSVNV
jgi:hypothetical protein